MNFRLKAALMSCFLLLTATSLVFAQQKGGSAAKNKKAKKGIVYNYEYTTYEVQKGDDYESVAKKNTIPTMLLKNFNPDAGEELAPGTFIKIPILQSAETVIANREKTVADSIAAQVLFLETQKRTQKENTIHIALLLPFNINKALDSIARPQHGTFGAALEFYEGLKIALDSLEPKGLHIKLYVFDTKNDSNQVKKLLDKPEISNCNLIIGPFNNTELNVVAQFARIKNIPFVSPLSTAVPLFINNPNAIIANTSAETQCKLLADFISTNYAKQNIIIPHTEKGNDADWAIQLKNFMAAKKAVGIKEVILSENSSKTMAGVLSPTQKNVILLLSSNEAQIAEVMAVVNDKKGKAEVIVYGPPSWDNLQTVDLELMQAVQTHIFKTDYTDQTATSVKTIRRKYFEEYKNDATTYVYQGFDVMFYLGSVIIQYGKDFYKNIPSYTQQGLHTKYNFKPNSPTGALENNNITILEMKDYEWKKVAPTPTLIAPSNKSNTQQPSQLGKPTAKPTK